MPEEKPAPSRLITAGNLLTFSRLVLLPAVIVGLALDHGYAVVAAMGAVVLTDLLDGRIARRLGQAGAFGKTLDSTVDFVLIYSLFIAFYAAGRLPTYQFAVIYLAMIAILLLQFSMVATDQADKVVRTKFGKVVGAIEYGYLIFLAALEVAPPSPAIATAKMAIFLVLALAIVLNTAECLVQVRRQA